MSLNNRETFYRDVASNVIRIHMERGECLFAPNAAEDIAHEVLSEVGDTSDQDAVLDALERAILAVEIYCPHEGVDRRSEFGISA